MHDTVISLFINRFDFGQNVCINNFDALPKMWQKFPTKIIDTVQFYSDLCFPFTVLQKHE